MFSRVASRLQGETNHLYKLRDELKSGGFSITDFISGNVSEYGIGYPQDVLEDILIRSSRSCRIYQPDSFGQTTARKAISRYYEERGIGINAGQFLLTPGTSVSYWYCFKLLADEGDEILCPHPSYPLFDYIAALSGVTLVSYPLKEGSRWFVDPDRLDACVSTRTRALVLISPHNPTGHVASEDEIAELAEIARRHDLAIICDEVFSEFLMSKAILPRPAGSTAPLVFTLNGFSKMMALPGMKLGWVAVSGDRDRVARALAALELISDTFLPVNEIAQAAVPELLQKGKPFLDWYSNEIRERWHQCRVILQKSRMLDFAPPEGGFYVTLRLEGLDEEQTSQELLRNDRLLLHPGHFYDLEPPHLVMSFVQHPVS